MVFVLLHLIRSVVRAPGMTFRMQMQGVKCAVSVENCKYYEGGSGGPTSAKVSCSSASPPPCGLNCDQVKQWDVFCFLKSRQVSSKSAGDETFRKTWIQGHDCFLIQEIFRVSWWKRLKIKAYPDFNNVKCSFGIIFWLYLRSHFYSFVFTDSQTGKTSWRVMIAEDILS